MIRGIMADKLLASYHHVKHPRQTSKGTRKKAYEVAATRTRRQIYQAAATSMDVFTSIFRKI